MTDSLQKRTCAAPEPVAYLYDGSLEGLLSAVFLAYERHERPEEIVRSSDYQPRLGQDSLLADTDYERAQRVRRGVERACGRDAFNAVMRASTCDGYRTGTVIFRFIEFALSRPAPQRSIPILDDLANPVVGELVGLERRAVNECEKMRQFIRFSHLENGIWFARCNPNASVVPLVMGYFAARLNDQAFIIFDEAHGVAGVYDGSGWSLVTADAVEAPAATCHDAEMQEAWKRFYDALSVDARYNPELRRHFLPVRLWRNITELQPRR